MIIIEIDGHSMQQYTESEAFLTAGTHIDDPVMERDVALGHWLEKRRWMLIEKTGAEDYAASIRQALDRGIDTLIVKETKPCQ